MIHRPTREPIIRLFHVHKRYGSQSALQDIDLTIFRNDFVFVTGPTGAGKTTLLRLLFLDEAVSEGHIIVGGVNLQRMRRSSIPFLRRKIGVVFQDFRLIQTYTVYENIALVLEALGIDRRYVDKKARHALRMVGLEDRANTYPPKLSGGEQQRVAIARAVVGNPAILLADELTGNLDPDAADLVFNLLKRLHDGGSTIIVATHDRMLFQKVRARIVFLKKGRIEREAAS